MPINSQHPDYVAALPIWQMCNDFTMGTRAVKAKGEKYLPRPNPEDNTPEANARYKNYLTRAVFYEYSSKTINQYLGLAFKQDPICELGALDFLKQDANGAGVSLYQLAQKGFRDLLANGRFGLWVDFTAVAYDTEQVSRQQNKDAGARPNILYYSATQIINWRLGNNRLEMVVLYEAVDERGDDGFEVKRVEQYRELGLDGGGYYVRVWRKGDSGWGEYSYKSIGLPYIPFMIFGSQFNTWQIQDVPIEPLVHIEHGIYCNSADAENSRFLCGQIQPFVNIDNQIADFYRQRDENGRLINRLRLGSETVMMLGESGTFGFAQASPNTMATQGIIEKREIIGELGYQLGQQGGIKTATQAENESAAQHSQASLCVANINEGMHQVLLWCFELMGVSGEPKFAIRQQFSQDSVDVNVLALLNTLVDGGKLPKSVIWNKAREFNLLDGELSDEDIEAMIEADYETDGIAGAVQAAAGERLPPNDGANRAGAQ